MRKSEPTKKTELILHVILITNLMGSKKDHEPSTHWLKRLQKTVNELSHILFRAFEKPAILVTTEEVKLW